MLNKFSAAYDAAMGRMNKVVGAVCVAILAAIFFMMTLEILSRSMFQVSYAWVIELSRFGLVFIIFFGGSMLFYESGHIAVTLFHDRISPKALEIVKTAFDVLALYFMFMYLVNSIDFAMAGLHTPSITRMMNMVYPRMAIPIGFVLMGLQVLNNLLKRLIKFKDFTPEQWAGQKKFDTLIDTVVRETASDAD